MLLNEIINEVGMTKRAVKYYEEKGLLSVDKDNNGYRNYTAQDVETLKKISVYRKLGISIKDIQSLLETGDKSILLRIYQEKVQEKVLKDSELEALKQFIDDGDADKANEALDYQTVENAIESLLPGKEWGDYFKSHFKTSVYKGYKRDKIEMRGDRAEMSDFPLYLNTVAGGLDRRDQTIGGFSFVVKIYAVPVVEIIG